MWKMPSGMVLMNKKGERMLEINFQAIASGIEVIILDNGIGRKESVKINREKRNKKKSFGLEITLDRVAAINKLYNQQIKVELEDRKDHAGKLAGTRVCIQIPYMPEKILREAKESIK